MNIKIVQMNINIIFIIALFVTVLRNHNVIILVTAQLLLLKRVFKVFIITYSQYFK